MDTENCMSSIIPYTCQDSKEKRRISGQNLKILTLCNDLPVLDVFLLEHFSGAGHGYAVPRAAAQSGLTEPCLRVYTKKVTMSLTAAGFISGAAQKSGSAGGQDAIEKTILEAKQGSMKKLWNLKSSAHGTPRKGWAAAVFAMALVLSVSGAGTALLLNGQPEALTVVPAVQQHTPEKTQKHKNRRTDTAPAQETKTEPESEAAEAPAAEAAATVQPETAQPAEEPAQAEETAQPEPAETEQTARAEQLPAQEPAAEPELDAENGVVTLQTETPELAAQDPQAPAADTDLPENSTTNQHTPEGSVLLTPEQIREALDTGTLNEAEAQCIDFGSENGFFSWLWNLLFGKKEESDPVYSGWRTENGKTYYYSPSTNQKVTGIKVIDSKLYYFDADGVMQKNTTFGIDVSKYQSGLDWEQIKKAGVSFVIIRIGYRGYGASGTLVKDPMFEEHFTNARNAGLKVGVYFFSQATTEDEAREEAEGCNWALNGRKLDYPIYFDTEASGAANGSGRADGLGVADRTKCAVAFCEQVKQLGYKPGVYASTLWFEKRLDFSQLKGYSIWNAHYDVPGSRIPCDLWQGTCTARLDGYRGDLDVNISYIG